MKKIRQIAIAVALTVSVTTLAMVPGGVATATSAEASSVFSKLLGGRGHKMGGKGFNLAALFGGGKGLGGNAYGGKKGGDGIAGLMGGLGPH